MLSFNSWVILNLFSQFEHSDTDVSYYWPCTSCFVFICFLKVLSFLHMYSYLAHLKSCFRRPVDDFEFDFELMNKFSRVLVALASWLFMLFCASLSHSLTKGVKLIHSLTSCHYFCTFFLLLWLPLTPKKQGNGTENVFITIYRMFSNKFTRALKILHWRLVVLEYLSQV